VQDTTTQPEVFMARAIELARKGLYSTAPNPRVGCVLVRDGSIVAEGWHVRAGEAHAEVGALDKVSQARGCTAYITLEPCSHHGRTPPCCDRLIAEGISQVVIATKDPNPQVAGQGIRRLEQAGIPVTTGVLAEQAVLLNRGYFKRWQTGTPWVQCKIAASLDGRTAAASGESKWITSVEAREDVQHFRAQSSAIVTGVNTVLADNPSLNVRLDAELNTITQPLRVVLDSHFRCPPGAKIFSLPGQTMVIGVAESGNFSGLKQKGVETCIVKERNGRPDLHQVLKVLAEKEINDVFLEAGFELSGAFMSEALIDELVLYLAPKLLGDQAKPLLKLPKLQSLADQVALEISDVTRVGVDLRVSAIVAPSLES